MIFQAPKIDARTSKEILEQALFLAKIYCPEWDPDIQNKDDIGVALLYLFSRLAETVTGQLNRVPEKQLLAFYDFIGIDHMPPAAAKVPLAFTLSKGSKQALVPARTRVASAEDAKILFETLEDLAAVDFTIKALYSYNPWEDSYTDHSAEITGSEDGYYIFGGDAKQKRIEHILYLSDSALDFNIPVDVTIKVNFTSSTPELQKYFSTCWDMDGNKLIGSAFMKTGNELDISFSQIALPRRSLNGREGNWISFQPSNKLPINNEALPSVSSISLDTKASCSPDAVFFNDTPVNVKKGFYPFGETPKIGDAFYIGGGELFSKAGATVSLICDLIGGTAAKDKDGKDLSLIWQYWSDSQWKFLTVTDNTSKFIVTGNISFTCPSIETAKINGLASKWIRARITSGGFGETAKYKPSNLTLTEDQKKILTSTYGANYMLGVYSEATYKPPFISSLYIQCIIQSKSPEHCVIYNNFKHEEIDMQKELPFLPYLLAKEAPSFFIGFEDYPANKAVTFYFSFKGRSFNDNPPLLKAPSYSGGPVELYKVQGFYWQYSTDSNAWEKFGPEDGTDLFSKSGIITFIVPSGIKKSEVFGKELYWIRVGFKEGGSWFEPPRLKGIFTNAVWAENARVIKDEVLGSSNGLPNQVFTFSSHPVLGNQVVEVREPSLSSKDELEAIESEVGINPLRLIKNDSGDVQEIWVRWHEVKTFAHSESHSRHYMIDRVEGKIIFGDGIRGMIPPALFNNILAREYKSGGGKNGNRKVCTVTELKTAIPGIDKVANFDSSSGGKNLETINNVITRAPFAIKNSGRAIIKEDFEWLAREASPDVSKAMCVKDGPDIKVIIAPRYDTGDIYPESGLLEQVTGYLRDRAFLMIRDRIKAVGPAYCRIDVETIVVPLHLSESALMADRVERKLRDYLHPITGGDEGNGWDFGQRIFISQIAALIEDVEGVDYITALALKKLVSSGSAEETFEEASISGNMWIETGDNELPYAGDISANITGGTD